MFNWLTGKAGNKIPPGECFEQLLKRKGILRMPGAHNAMAALLAKRCGFEALYVSVLPYRQV